MRRVLFVLFAIATFSLCMSAFAQFTQGEKLSHNLSVCISKADAVEIVNTDEKDGFDAASKVWNAKAECVTLPVVGPVVGKVVHSAMVKRNGQKVRAHVVEILVDGKPVAYFITSESVSVAGGVPGTERQS